MHELVFSRVKVFPKSFPVAQAFGGPAALPGNAYC